MSFPLWQPACRAGQRPLYRFTLLPRFGDDYRLSQRLVPRLRGEPSITLAQTAERSERSILEVLGVFDDLQRHAERAAEVEPLIEHLLRGRPLDARRRRMLGGVGADGAQRRMRLWETALRDAITEWGALFPWRPESADGRVTYEERLLEALGLWREVKGLGSRSKTEDIGKRLRPFIQESSLRLELAAGPNLLEMFVQPMTPFAWLMMHRFAGSLAKGECVSCGSTPTKVTRKEGAPCCGAKRCRDKIGNGRRGRNAEMKARLEVFAEKKRSAENKRASAPE